MHWICYFNVIVNSFCACCSYLFFLDSLQSSEGFPDLPAEQLATQSLTSSQFFPVVDSLRAPCLLSPLEAAFFASSVGAQLTMMDLHPSCTIFLVIFDQDPVNCALVSLLYPPLAFDPHQTRGVI